MHNTSGPSKSLRLCFFTLHRARESAASRTPRGPPSALASARVPSPPSAVPSKHSVRRCGAWPAASTVSRGWRPWSLRPREGAEGVVVAAALALVFFFLALLAAPAPAPLLPEAAAGA